jgi:hypothetical protein
VRREAIVWYFASFGLLLAAGVSIALAARSFLSSLTPLYVAIGLSVGAIGCAMVALARQVDE